MAKSKPIENATPRWREFTKRLVQKIKYKAPYEQALMIMGNQRSGTSLFAFLLNQLPYSQVFGEFSVLSDQDEKKIRLNPIDDVNRILQKEHAPMVVLKPLVESQNAIALLDQIPRSKIVWVYRQYKDVVKSDLKLFTKSNGIGNLRPIMAKDRDNWRAQGVSDEVYDTIAKYFSEDMSPRDAASLFWYARNSLFFEQNLAENDKVYILKYEDFVSKPEETVNSLLTKLDMPLAKPGIAKKVFTSSVSKKSDVEVSPEIEALCDEMYERLEQAYQQQFASEG